MNFLSALLNSLPGAAAQGLIWGLMAIGVYITFRILDVADLTVDGSIATGGAAAVMLIRAGMNPWLALLCAFVCGMLAGFVTGMFHTKCGIPAILSGILTQLALYSINLRIMDSKANQAVGVDKYPLMVSQRFVRDLSLKNPLPVLLLFTFAVIALLYGARLRHPRHRRESEHGPRTGHQYERERCIWPHAFERSCRPLRRVARAVSGRV